MTVSSETNRSGPFNGNGVTTAFDYEFRITNEAYVSVIKNVDGVETTLTLGADYIVTGVGDDGGGQIVCTVAPAVGATITNLLNVPFTQETDLENQGAYFAQTVEDALDLAAQRSLQLKERIDRAIVIPASADPSELDTLIENVIRLADSVDAVVTVAGIEAEVEAVAAITDVIPSVPGLTADAQAAASAADASEAAAATSETNAAGSATLAQKWAANPEDVEVSGGLFSAFHWYRKTLAIYNAVANTLAGWIHAATAKTSMVAADEFGFWDSVSGALRKITFQDFVWQCRCDIGGYYYVDTSKTGAVAPPSGTTGPVFIELSAGLTGAGSFNNGKLTSESVSGSGALVVATAVVSLAGSPILGQTVDLINTEGRMLRPSTSPGTKQNDQMQRTTGRAGPFVRFTPDVIEGALSVDTTAPDSAIGGSTSRSMGRVQFDSATSPNARVSSTTDGETRVKNVGVKVYMRVK